MDLFSIWRDAPDALLSHCISYCICTVYSYATLFLLCIAFSCMLDFYLLFLKLHHHFVLNKCIGCLRHPGFACFVLYSKPN